jgi:hypothetical protein
MVKLIQIKMYKVIERVITFGEQNGLFVSEWLGTISKGFVASLFCQASGPSCTGGVRRPEFPSENSDSLEFRYVRRFAVIYTSLKNKKNKK